MMRSSSYRILGDGSSSNSWMELLNRYVLEMVNLKPDGRNLFQVCAGGFVHSWSAVPRLVLKSRFWKMLSQVSFPWLQFYPPMLSILIGARRLA